MLSKTYGQRAGKTQQLINELLEMKLDSNSVLVVNSPFIYRKLKEHNFEGKLICSALKK